MCPATPFSSRRNSQTRTKRVMVNEYLNQFIQLSRYTIDATNTDKKKHDTFLKGLNDKI
jgi:hypothetical protein